MIIANVNSTKSAYRHLPNFVGTSNKIYLQYYKNSSNNNNRQRNAVNDEFNRKDI